ncbi:hypothetical protein PIB30_101070, partial [Stylosanthes scabra]|nr:hypothetical protein [Stylosanthes scabra]
GDRLHAVLPRSLFNRWRGVLKEFHSYNMKWFIVSEDKLKSKSTDIDMFLTFGRLTQVTHVSKPAFPLEALKLKSIGELLQADRIDEAEMFGMLSV